MDLKTTAEDGLKPETVSAEPKSEATRDVFFVQHPSSLQYLHARHPVHHPQPSLTPLTSSPGAIIEIGECDGSR